MNRFENNPETTAIANPEAERDSEELAQLWEKVSGDREQVGALLKYEEVLLRGLEDAKHWDVENRPPFDYIAIASKMNRMGMVLPDAVGEELSTMLDACKENPAQCSEWRVSALVALLRMGKATDEQIAQGLAWCDETIPLSDDNKGNQWVGYAAIVSAMHDTGKDIPDDARAKLKTGFNVYMQDDSIGPAIDILTAMIRTGTADDESVARGLDACTERGWYDHYVRLVAVMQEAGMGLPPDVDSRLSAALAWEKDGRWNTSPSILSTMIRMGKATDEQITEYMETYKHDWKLRRRYRDALLALHEKGRPLLSGAKEQLVKDLEHYKKEGVRIDYANTLFVLDAIDGGLPDDVGDTVRQYVEEGIGGEWIIGDTYSPHYKLMVLKFIEAGKAPRELIDANLEILEKRKNWKGYAEIIAAELSSGEGFAQPGYRALSEHIRSLPDEAQTFAHSFAGQALRNGDKKRFVQLDRVTQVFQSLRNSAIGGTENTPDSTAYEKPTRGDRWEEDSPWLGRLFTLDPDFIEKVLQEDFARGTADRPVLYVNPMYRLERPKGVYEHVRDLFDGGYIRGTDTFRNLTRVVSSLRRADGSNMRDLFTLLRNVVDDATTSSSAGDKG